MCGQARCGDARSGGVRRLDGVIDDVVLPRFGIQASVWDQRSSRELCELSDLQRHGDRIQAGNPRVSAALDGFRQKLDGPRLAKGPVRELGRLGLPVGGELFSGRRVSIHWRRFDY